MKLQAMIGENDWLPIPQMIDLLLLGLLAAVRHYAAKLGRVCLDRSCEAPREKLLSHLTDSRTAGMFGLDTQMVSILDFFNIY
jgi:hypothetical protein